MWILENGTENELEQIKRTSQVGLFLSISWRQYPGVRPPLTLLLLGSGVSGLFFLTFGELNEHWNVSVIWTARMWWEIP